MGSVKPGNGTSFVAMGVLCTLSSSGGVTVASFLGPIADSSCIATNVSWSTSLSSRPGKRRTSPSSAVPPSSTGSSAAMSRWRAKVSPGAGGNSPSIMK